MNLDGDLNSLWRGEGHLFELQVLKLVTLSITPEQLECHTSHGTHSNLVFADYLWESHRRSRC